MWRAIVPRARRGLEPPASRASADRRPRAEFALLLADPRWRPRQSRAPARDARRRAGIGKSRLVFELVRRLDERVDLVDLALGRSSPYRRGLVLGPRRDRQGSGGHARDGRCRDSGEQARAAVRDFVTSTPEAARIESQLRSLVGLSPRRDVHGDQRRAAFVAWRRFLEALARRRTLVLVFEDVQWADDGLLDFIEPPRRGPATFRC